MRKACLLVFILLTQYLSARSEDYLITKFGIGTDSTVLNTSAIQRVIDQAANNGGGTIVIPRGVFLSGALFFKPKTHLRLLEGAVLKGSDNINNYPYIASRMEGRSQPYFAALINAYQVEGFTITGPGEINGNGLRFWKAFWSHRDSLRKIGKETTNLEVHRPRLIFIWASNNVTIRQVKLRDAGFWTTHLYQCENVLIDSCDIRSPFKPVAAPSTDGIDLDVCKKVTIRNCYISVNDDAICIKGGKGPNAHNMAENGIVEDILVEHCTFGPAHASVTIGSESIHARNITVRNCVVDNDCPLFKFKMRPDTYQVFENITVENITGKCGVVIDLNPWKQFFDLGGSKEKPFGTVRNVTMSNINVSCQRLGDVSGNPGDQISEILLKDITVKAAIQGLNNKYKGVVAKNVIVNGSLLIN